MQRALRIEHEIGDIEGDLAGVVGVADLEPVEAREEELAEFLAVLGDRSLERRSRARRVDAPARVR
jgi:hypothetical protein